jgi:hypothetical protein
MKERLIKKYNRRLRMIQKPEVNAKNEITATAEVVLAVLKIQFWYN